MEVVELTLALSVNDNTITIINSFFNSCDGKAYWSKSVKQYGNMMILFILIFELF
jgi:hypothetical protein